MQFVAITVIEVQASTLRNPSGRTVKPRLNLQELEGLLHCFLVLSKDRPNGAKRSPRHARGKALT